MPVQLHLARERPTVIGVRATKPKLKPWLRTVEFDALVSRTYGGKPQYEIAELLETNPSSLSKYRQGERPVSAEFIAAAMEAFPGIPTQQYVISSRRR